jgi:hypothetical protein
MNQLVNPVVNRGERFPVPGPEMVGIFDSVTISRILEN